MSSIYNWIFGGAAPAQDAQPATEPSPDAVAVRFLVLPTRNCHLDPVPVTAAFQESLDKYVAFTGDDAAVLAITVIEPKLARIHGVLSDGKLTHGRDVLVSYLASAMALLLEQPVLVVPISIAPVGAHERAAKASELGQVVLKPLPPKQPQGVHTEGVQLQ